MGLNLARIVHRLMTSPRGWRVSALQQELEIAPRTYRKYRRMLQETFDPFRRRDGESMVVEVLDGDERYLRLRPPREFGLSSPELELYTAAVYLAADAFSRVGSPHLERAGEMLVSDFHAGVRDRDFILNGLLSDADRMFLVERTPVHLPFADDLVRAMVNRRRLRLGVGSALLEVCPLTLRVDRGGATLVALNGDEIVEFDTRAIQSVEVLSRAFDYPNRSRYLPEISMNAPPDAD